MRRIFWALALGAATWAWTGPSVASASAVVSPPATIASNCAKDVSPEMQHWLNWLPPHAYVMVPPGSCYLVDEGLRLAAPQGLTINGGTWFDATVPVPGASPKNMNPVFWMIGGSGVTLENMRISGVHAGGYNPSGAFAAAIRSDGVIGLTVTNLSASHVYGDGVELGPLRAENDLSGTILNPTENAVVSNVSVDGAGRQGVTLSSVNGATLASIGLTNIGINGFDIEADQWNEGAKNVTINGCTVGGDLGGLFFANGGASAGGSFTGGITVEGCTMTRPQAGDVILVQDPSPKDLPRGPFTFSNNTLLCGSSVYVACVQSVNANVSVRGSSLQMPAGTIHEPVYHASVSSSLVFSQDMVSFFGSLGWRDATSTVSVTGGAWTPYGASPAAASPGAPTKSSAVAVAYAPPAQGSSGSGAPTAVLASAHSASSPAASTIGPATLAAASLPPQQGTARALVFAVTLACGAYIIVLLGRRRRVEARRARPATAASALDLLAPTVVRADEGGVTTSSRLPN